MSQQSVSVSVEKEVSDLMGALVGLVAAVKAGSSAAELAIKELPVVIQMIGEVSAIPNDLKNDLPGSMNAAALGVSQLLALFV